MSISKSMSYEERVDRPIVLEFAASNRYLVHNKKNLGKCSGLPGFVSSQAAAMFGTAFRICILRRSTSGV
jgi:hypothetical protein